MEQDTERRAVRTYVPAYQKEVWREEAEALDMSQSEFVRTMVQAGRRGFDLDSPAATQKPSAGVSSAPDPGGDGLEERVVETLRGGTQSWDELVEELAGDFESRLDETLDSLQGDNRVRYSGREGGYVLVDHE